MRSALAALLLTATPAAYAEEPAMPDFLAGTALYAQDIAACPASANGTSDEALAESLQLNSAGIYGVAFSCTFVAMHPENDPESGITYGWVAIAQCSDENTIAFPDMMSLVPAEDGASLSVRSQKEHIIGSVIAREPGRDPNTNPMLEAAFVSGTYQRCP